MITIPLLQDSQNLIWRYSSVSGTMADWVKAQKPDAVIHVGDMVDWPRDEDWGRYAAMHDRMSGTWPISEAVGNHDYDNWDDPQSQRDLFARRGDHPVRNFRRFIPMSNVVNAVDTYPAGQPTGNVVQTFTAEGYQFAIIALMCWPFDDELAWLESMIKKYSNYAIIINTHDYMNQTSRSDHGDRIWAIAKKYSNVSFITSGHYFPAAGHRSDRGDNGNTVHQLMFNYQNYDQRDPNTYIQLIRIDPATKTATVKTYSPVLNRYMTGTNHDFMLANVNLLKSGSQPVPEPQPEPQPSPGGKVRINPGVTVGPVGTKIVNFVDKWYPKASELYVTSAYRPTEADGGRWSHHNGQVYRGSNTAAVDFAAPMTDAGRRQMQAFARWLYDNFGDLTVEMLHSTPYADDNGFLVRNQVKSGLGYPEHTDHVHYATSSTLIDQMEARAQQKWGAPPPRPEPEPQPSQGIPVDSFGVDYSFSRPSVAGLKAANVKFAFRYLSFENNLTKPKLLTNAEALALSQAGIAVVSNFEWYAERCTEGFAAGAQDADTALAQAKAAGAPDGKPIYFSVDIDTSPESVYDYFRGIASKMPLDQIGVYGSYRVVKGLKEAGLVTWLWQTYAWSDGQWYAGRHVEQYLNAQKLAGGDVDFNRNKTTDFGQWFHVSVGGNTPAPEPAPVNPVRVEMAKRDLKTKIGDIWAQEQNGTNPGSEVLPDRRQVKLNAIEAELARLTGGTVTAPAVLSPSAVTERDLETMINDMWTQRVFGTSGYVDTPAASFATRQIDNIEAMVKKLATPEEPQQ